MSGISLHCFASVFLQVACSFVHPHNGIRGFRGSENRKRGVINSIEVQLCTLSTSIHHKLRACWHFACVPVYLCLRESAKGSRRETLCTICQNVITTHTDMDRLKSPEAQLHDWKNGGRERKRETFFTEKLMGIMKVPRALNKLLSSRSETMMLLGTLKRKRHSGTNCDSLGIDILPSR